MARFLLILGLLLGLAAAAKEADRANAGANPLRKVISLLQGLRKEVEAEGEKSKELYEKFMCYCETNEAEKTKSVDDARARVGSLEATIKELSGSNAQLEQEVTDLKGDIEEDTKGVEDATAVRKKEAAEFSAEAADTTNSVAALDKAIPALEKGLAPDAAVLTQIGARILQRGGGGGISDDQVQTFRSILMQLQSGQAQPSGGSAQILGVLQQMRDDMKANLQAMTTEKEEKESRLAGQKQALADAQGDLEDTSETLAEDEKFLYNLKTQCATKTKEFEAEEKERQMEVLAIADTIKILNDDDAQEMFKKTLPSPAGADAAAASFMQMKMSTKRGGFDDFGYPGRMEEASRLLQENIVQGGPRSIQMRMVAAQMRRGARQMQMQPEGGNKFAPIMKSVQDMIVSMRADQEDDDKHKDYCNAETNRVKGEKDDLNQNIETIQTKMTDAEATITTLKEEIKTLKTELETLDAQMLVATAQRKQEKQAHTQTVAELQVSGSLLTKAKERLSSFYAPAAASLIQVQEQTASNDPLAQSLGFSSPPSSDSSLNSQVDALFQTSSQQSPRGGAGMGIVGMLEQLQGELKTQMAMSNQEEAEAVKDFEQLSADTTAAKQAKSKQVIDKEGNLATIAEAVQDMSTQKDEASTELTAVLEKAQAINADCSFLLENYDIRKRARGAELEGLSNALGVLSSGADMSFVQLKATSSRKVRALRHGKVQ